MAKAEISVEELALLRNFLGIASSKICYGHAYS
jgi:hypothetical protein